MIQVKYSIKGKINSSQKIEGKINNSIITESPELEDITIVPSTEEQKLKSDMYGYGEVTVKAIPTTDITIIPSAEEQVKTGIFGTVKVEAVKGETLYITPAEQVQVYEGLFEKVTVEATETTAGNEKDYAINNIAISTENGELILAYDEVNLDVDFNIDDEQNLIVNNNEGNIDFAINENDELEVIY